MSFKLDDYTLENGEIQAFAWPGGYPIYYMTRDSGVLCPTCVNKELHIIKDAISESESDPQWEIIGASINYEDKDLYCDHCGREIEVAYE